MTLYEFVGGPLDGARRTTAGFEHEAYPVSLHCWNPDHPREAGPSVKLKACYWYSLENGKFHYNHAKTMAANAKS